MSDTAPPDAMDEPLFPIRELSRLTGVNSVTLRAWERRYGLLVPKRTAKGHRLYSTSDVRRVADILSWINRGVSVGKVRSLIDETPGADTSLTDEWKTQRRDLIEAARAFNEGRIESLYFSVTKQYPAHIVIDQWIYPVMARLNQDSENAIVESFLASTLRSLICGHVKSLNKQNQSPCILLIAASDALLWRHWISALWLADRGYLVKVVEDIPEQQSWLDLVEPLKSDVVAFYGERRWSDAMYDQLLEKLKFSRVDCYLAGPGIWLDYDAGRVEPISGLTLAPTIYRAVHLIAGESTDAIQTPSSF
jgi:DNA-binding transcriptional MerR regulator